MIPLLTLFSVVAVWGLLILLVISLILLRKSLEPTRRHLENVTMGVRAIERQTQPLGQWSRELTGSLQSAGADLERLEKALSRSRR